MSEPVDLHPRVLAALMAAGVPFQIRRHADCDQPIHTPADFARCLGRPLDVITKSLFLEIATTEAPAGFALAVCSVPHRADFSVLARRWNAALVRLASREVLFDRLGYPPTGVSPLGWEEYPVAIDEAVFAHQTILVGGGVPGVEVEIAPGDLQRACGASRLAFAHP